MNITIMLYNISKQNCLSLARQYKCALLYVKGHTSIEESQLLNSKLEKDGHTSLELRSTPLNIPTMILYEQKSYLFYTKEKIKCNNKWSNVHLHKKMTIYLQWHQTSFLNKSLPLISDISKGFRCDISME